MRICVFIQVGALPAAWIAVGVGVLAVLLIMTILFLLKWREAVVLKKEVLELRDTIRMMRQEELSLSRMLYKTGESVSPIDEELLQAMAEEADEEVGSSEEVNQALPLQEILVEEPSVDSTENVIENSAEILENPTASVENPIESIESPIKPVEKNVESPAGELPIAPTHKQPITGRRPAIPNDLFAAWFAENEDMPAVEVADEKPQQASSEVQAEEEEPIDEVSATAAVAEKVGITETVVQEHGADLPMEQPAEVGLSKEDERFCRKLERFIGARLRNPNLNIDSIAAQFGIGRTNFYRKVRELTGMSPNDYLRKCRMERAAELLQHSDVAISDVCAQVGIPDAQYFCRVFKTYFGVTPSVYREKHNQYT